MPMLPSSQPQQKSYRKGSSLYFTAGLVVSMVLIVTAFEWKTTYLLSEEDVIELSGPDTGPVIDHKPTLIPELPTPKPLGRNIVPVPDPPVSPILEPPVPPIDEPVESGPALPPGLLSGTGAPGDDLPEMPNITQAAEPAAGYDAFYAYIFDRVNVPDHLIRRNQDGKVYVSFVVDRDGKLTDIEIMKGFDKQLEAQILKILQDAPAWKPAWQHGSPIKQRMVLPIAIKITH